jgi:hypothetical protein
MTVVASGYERQVNDLYETPEWVTRALIRAIEFNPGKDVVWEPAAGNHKIADVLRAGGASVRTSDIAVYDRQHDASFDFLGSESVNFGARHIITNPPYGKGNRDAVKFARLALQRCNGVVALLLSAKFDFGKTRRDLFRDNPRFIAKVALLDRIQWFAGEHGSTEDHAWFVWGSRDNRTPARLLWEVRQEPSGADTGSTVGAGAPIANRTLVEA